MALLKNSSSHSAAGFGSCGLGELEVVADGVLDELRLAGLKRLAPLPIVSSSSLS